MKLLLDTHILIWYFDGDRRLSTKAREAIDETLKRKEGKPPHKDPFDNLMLVQAVAEEMMFITHDEHIAEYDCENVFKI